MIRINLLSEGRRPVVARRTRPTLRLGDQDPSIYVLAAGLIFGLLGAGLFWFWLNTQINAKDRSIATAQRKYEELRPYIEEVEAYQLQKAELERKVGVIADLRAKQRGPVRVMDEVSRALPELVWLEQMDIIGSTVTLRGRAFNTNAVATFIANLRKVPEFREPSLRDLPADRGGETYSFNLNFNFVNEPIQAAETDDAGAEDDGDAESET